MEQFFVANRLKYGDDKSKAVFLTIVGKKNHTADGLMCATETFREEVARVN